MEYAKKTTNKQTTQSSSANQNDSSRTGAGGSTTVMFKRVSAPTSESELQNLDLNVVSDVRTLT